MVGKVCFMSAFTNVVCLIILGERATNWMSSVYFLFVATDWDNLTISELQDELKRHKQVTTGTKAELLKRLRLIAPSNLEISGTAFAITSRRFITCHHCVYNEHSQSIVNRVAICKRIQKEGERIVPQQGHTLYYADIHRFDAMLDYAIFHLESDRSLQNLVPIPICPEAKLPDVTSHSISCLYGAIGDFQVGELASLSVWIGGPYDILQYGNNNVSEPNDSRILTEQGLCRGSSGGAMVSNGYVVAMHLASLNQGRYFQKHVKGSHLAASVHDSVTDLQTIHSSLKEGLVLCRIPGIMDAVNGNS